MDDFYSKDDSSPWFEALAGLSFAAMLTFGFIFGGSGGAVGRIRRLIFMAAMPHVVAPISK
ncbi:hypothetical protein [Novosphingobium sp.]|uniref:hypothetical protein n=1 Tax=Novosphingobium sp. TaxID=1874826 RepID=UPI00286C4286|nr:hypothetical protein [Novosphingobium sp.]